MLWLAVYLPALPLEIFTRGVEKQKPCILSDGQHRRACVLLANSQAMQAGISVGMSVSAATVLLSSVTIYRRQMEHENEALEKLATWAGQFSSMVSLIKAPGLVIEIEASIKLFGSLDHLIARIQNGLSDLGYQAAYAVAPTPLAAEWVAFNLGTDRAETIKKLLDKSRLADVLSRLPLHIIGFSSNELRDLGAMGLRTFGDILRLPRKALTQRIGPDWRQKFDQALGIQADPRTAWEAPLSFYSHILLPSIAVSSQALLFAGQRLLQELVGQLHATQTGVQTLKWALQHEDQSQTCFTQSMLSVSRDLSKFRLLFQESMQNMTLSSAVQDIALRVETLIPMTASSQDLFVNTSPDSGSHEDFVERLYARLGKETISGVDRVMDHRPEYAWRLCKEDVWTRDVRNSRANSRDSQADLLRPIWLLKTPERLHIKAGRPFFRGQLELSDDYECIESGWWDSHDVRRDYFIARNESGECFWVYRERGNSNHWYMHGFFG